MFEGVVSNPAVIRNRFLADGASTPEAGAKMLFHGRRMVKEGQGGPFDSDE
jgi:hypothetical protein